MTWLINDPLVVSILSIAFPILVALFYLFGLDSKVIYQKQTNQSTMISITQAESINQFALQIMKWQKMVIFYLDGLFFPFACLILKLCDVKYYRQVLRYKKPDEITSVISEIFRSEVNLSNASNIVCVMGELGSEVLENSNVLEGLKNAYKNHKAKIHIIGGPRVDPKSNAIFNLANLGELDIYRTRTYKKNHFHLITYIDGDEIVVNEGIHDEAIWSGDKKNAILNKFARHIFVFKNKKRYIKYLKTIAKIRTSRAEKILANPGLEPDQKTTFILWQYNSIKTKFLQILQFLSICLDIPLLPIDR